MFAFLVGSISMFANEVATVQHNADALIEIELPLTIAVPDEVLSLNQIATAGPLQDLLDALVEVGETVLGLLLPDVITLVVMGIEDGLTIVTAGADLDLWGVTLIDAAFNAILSTEGATVSIELDLLPGILAINLVISVMGS